MKGLLRKYFGRRNQADRDFMVNAESDKVIPDHWARDEVVLDFLVHKLSHFESPVLLLGSDEKTNRLREGLSRSDVEVESFESDMDPGKVDEFVAHGKYKTVLVCWVPDNVAEWSFVNRLRDNISAKVVCVHELVLPMKLFQACQSSTRYIMHSESLLHFYAGPELFFPLNKLSKDVDFAGKSIIEFGPCEGWYTAGLSRLGAKSIRCIEARPENVMKLLVARQTYGWDNVEFTMDDFHNANGRKYGRYDIAYALGVYYHTYSPFTFLENLISLSDTILLGGWCVTESQPSRPKKAFDLLEYQGKKYRAKSYVEGNSCLCGVGGRSYWFQRDDLMGFFRERGFKITEYANENYATPEEMLQNWGFRHHNENYPTNMIEDHFKFAPGNWTAFLAQR